MLLLHAWTPVWTDSLNKTLMLEPFVLNSVPQISYEPMDQHLVCRINGKQYLSENNRKGLFRRIFIRVFSLNLYIPWGALAKEGGGKMDFVVKKKSRNIRWRHLLLGKLISISSCLEIREILWCCFSPFSWQCGAALFLPPGGI